MKCYKSKITLDNFKKVCYNSYTIKKTTEDKHSNGT